MFIKTALVFSSIWLLAACGESDQKTLGAITDQSVVAGTGVKVFTDPGWTPGDRASWANHLKARASYGQNDHARSPQ
ncbi:hypothetical protein [Limnohabitans sp.]|jgi:hypothetical protein|uniref:hypothetical protein n=1 Tax=Limnohabitans sp. TaxID=1907725 RepID=UPI0037BE2C9D